MPVATAYDLVASSSAVGPNPVNGARTFAHFFSDICSTERVPAMMLRHSMRLTPAISDKESPSSRIEPYIVTLPPVHGD